jgi:hypothetical protein
MSVTALYTALSSVFFMVLQYCRGAGFLPICAGLPAGGGREPPQLPGRLLKAAAIRVPVPAANRLPPPGGRSRATV